ncbi:protein GRINL1A [Ambystoma mexicanum]|uniref:protein GRINL1A n=1 Tax=Ambystoma mexicanum TaxID=8296 RepID=UPI0037E859E3
MSLAEEGSRGKTVRLSERNLRGRSQQQSFGEQGAREKSHGERELRVKSGEELREMLARQQKLLENRSFICKLPDKGKRISDFAEKLRAVIAEQQELKRTTELLSSFKLDFQKNIDNLDERKSSTDDLENPAHPMLLLIDSTSTSHNSESNMTITENQHIQDTVSTSNIKRHGEYNREDHTDVESVGGQLKEPGKCESLSHSLTDGPGHRVSKSVNGLLSVTGCAIEACDVNTDMLITAIQNVTITDKLDGNTTSRNKQENGKLKKTVPFLAGIPKKLHYIEVLENRADHPVLARPKFRPNQLASGSNESSRSSSPGRSPARIESSLSAEERHMRDKYRSDFTSARVPQLQNMPVQLIAIDESVNLQVIQKQTYEEMQAKLAAQKLAERLNIKMVKYNPDDGASMKYREVRDDDYYSEDEL